MKKSNLLGVLSVAIIAAGIMLLQSTPANAENLTLTVTAAAGAGCTAGTDLSAGSVASSYDAQSTTGTFGSAFICTGTSATESTYTLSSTDVVGPNTTTLTDIKAKLTSQDTAAGDPLCGAAVTITGAWTTINSSPENILHRNALGYPCTLSTNTLGIAVVVTANASVGLYTGTLTFTANGW